MFMSSREACAALAPLGLSRGQAQRALTAGLAGEPVRTRSAVLYDEHRVRSLADRPAVPWSDAFDLCPSGLFVARRMFDVGLPRAQQVAALSGGWGAVSPWSLWELSLPLRVQRHPAFVATVAGFVVFGADIVGLRGGDQLLLESPGEWFEAFEGRRLPTGPGRPWLIFRGTAELCSLRPEKIAG